LSNFNDLGLAAPLLEAVKRAGYESPTPIQAKAIPAVLAGSDLLGIAQTGTGKTAAFALPIIQRLTANRRPPQRKSCHVLVLSPTRELATQIADAFRTFGKPMGLTVAVVFGGVGHGPQIQALSRGVDVLVATPGRLLDHLAERHVSLTQTGTLVLDEGDQMLDLGFLPSIRRIVSHLPAQRQSLFFSATLAPEIDRLTREVLRDPVKVSVAPAATTCELVSQRVIHIDATRKRELLVELLSGKEHSRTLIFTRTKRGADRVAKHLDGAGIEAAAIHGNKSQRQREQALDAFRRGRIGVLVATDIAARGIDIDGVSHVVNFELPEVPETYVHRIGRTARAGASGIAISLCDVEEKPLLRDIERLIRQAIPAEDRRQDASLAATPSAPSRPRHERRHGSNGHSNGNGHGHAHGRRDNGERRQHDNHARPSHAHRNAGEARNSDRRSGAGQGRDDARPSRSNGQSGSNGRNGQGRKRSQSGHSSQSQHHGHNGHYGHDGRYRDNARARRP
jgi:ATP-dependent RNA helicase RhlE